VIGLRIVHALRDLRPAATARGAIALAGWMRAHQHEVLLVAGPGELADEAIAAGLETLSFREGGGSWWFGGRRKLAAAVQHWAPDIIHLHQAEVLPTFLDLAGRCGAKLVLSLDSLPPDSLLGLIQDPGLALVLVTDESLLVRLVRGAGLSKDRVALLPPAVTVGTRSLPLDGRCDRLLALGRFDEPAGFHDLLQALGLLRERGCTPTATLVGAGDGAGRLYDAVAAARLDGQVRIVPRGQRPLGLLADHDVLVHIGQDDATSVTVLEAMAAARPVVAESCGAATCWIRDGRTGLLVPPSSPVALAEALQSLVVDPARARAIGLAGQHQVQASHTLAVIGHTAHELYRLALRPRRDSEVGSGHTTSIYRKVSAQRAATEGFDG
jgi:glycosyltransferase involved in cell wall biosynthesis